MRTFGIVQADDVGTVRGFLIPQGSTILLPGDMEALAVDPPGRYLCGADRDSDQLPPWKTDPAGGALTPVGPETSRIVIHPIQIVHPACSSISGVAVFFPSAEALYSSDSYTRQSSSPSTSINDNTRR